MSTNPQLDSSALALIDRKPATKRASKLATMRVTSVDRRVYLLFRNGVSTPEIAARLKMKEERVMDSIQRYEIHRSEFSNEMIDLALNQMVMGAIPRSEKVIIGAMNATRPEKVMQGKKMIIKQVADHSTRMQAVELVKTIAEVARPKGGGLVLNQQFNNGGQPAAGRSLGRTFEERVRKNRQRMGVLEDADTLEAEIVEQGRESLSEELAEIDIDLEDEEDEDGESSEEEQRPQ